MDFNEFWDKAREVAEGHGWDAILTRIEGSPSVASFYRSIEGKDAGFELTLDDGEDAERLVELANEYVEGFDVDYETYLWLDKTGHGANGAPYHIKDILRTNEMVLTEMEILVNDLGNLLNEMEE